MKKSRFADSQIIAIPKQAEAGTPTPVQVQRTGHIEIIRHQTTVRVHGLVDQDTLRIVLQCLVP